jgi:hypothetical protein
LTRPIIPEPVINPSAIRRVGEETVAVGSMHYRTSTIQEDQQNGDSGRVCLSRFVLNTLSGWVEIRSYRDKIELLMEKRGNRRHVFLDTRRFLEYFRSTVAPHVTAPR